MDDRRFDQITRSLAGAGNRRDFLRRLLGIGGVAAGAAVLSTHGADAARRGYAGPLKPTPKPPVPCGGLTAPCAHNADCCSNFCEQAPVPSGGLCQECDATICGDFVCTDLLWDPRNCGSCGHICGAGLTCDSGTCKAPK